LAARIRLIGLAERPISLDYLPAFWWRGGRDVRDDEIHAHRKPVVGETSAAAM